MPSSIQHLADGGFFEGPRWHGGRWFVSDFYQGAVYSYSESGSRGLVLKVDLQPSGMGWLPDDSLIVVSMKDQRLLCREPGGSVREFADLSKYAGGRLNDMVVDQKGRSWVGNFGYDVFGPGPAKPADLIRVDPDGTVAIAAPDMQMPNGSVVTEDGQTLIVSEAGERLTAFTIADDGSLIDRRVWAEVSGVDGCCLDAEGHIWVASPREKCCRLIAEGGEVLDEVHPGDEYEIYACMLGGADGRTLLMCGAPGYVEDSEERLSAPPAVLLTTTVDVARAGLP